MNAKDLSTAVNEVVKLAQTRIEGVGQQQYEESKDRQKFESMSIPDLLEYMEEVKEEKRMEEMDVTEKPLPLA